MLNSSKDGDLLIHRPIEPMRASQPAIVTQRVQCVYEARHSIIPFPNIISLLSATIMIAIVSMKPIWTTCQSLRCTDSCNPVMNHRFQMLVKPMGKMILSFTLLFLPLMNFVFYALIWNSMSQYNKAKRVFRNNLLLIQNPFQNMIYSPEVCEIMGKNHWFFSVEEKGKSYVA